MRHHALTSLELFPSDMHAGDHPFVIVDTETTGLNPEGGDRLLELAAIRVAGGVTVSTFASLVHPERAIPAEAIRVHGIRDDMVAHAPPAAEPLRWFLDFIRRDTVVFQNAPFDRAFLNAELRRAGLPPFTNPFLDTRLMARLFWPGMEGYGLGRLAIRAGVSIPETRHRALADAELTLGVFRVLLAEARRAGVCTVVELRARCRVVREAMRENSPASAAQR